MTNPNSSGGGAALETVAWQDSDWVQTEQPTDICSDMANWIPLVRRADAESAIRTLEERVASLEAERSELTDVLNRGGFVRCDIAACNCGSWHARFGWRERFREFTDALEEHGANLDAGKTALTLLKELLGEPDAE